MIKVRDLYFSYTKDSPVLEDISFDILDGECVVLLGSNGVGKSTLIKCITGSLKPNSGSIYFDNEDASTLKNKDKAKYVSFVPQLINGNALTIKETITLGRIPHFDLYPHKSDLEKVEDALAKFSLKGIENKLTSEISGGERQKCAIARAFVQEAKTIIFDEPTSNLDIKAQIGILKLIKKISKEEGKSSLISMHDINQAMLVADKFVFLKNNKIHTICAKEEINETLLSEIYDLKIKMINQNGRKVVIYE